MNISRFDSQLTFRLYKSALNGDMHAARFLVSIAQSELEHRQLPAQGLLRFYLRLVSDPARYAEVMEKDPPSKKPGRPSIDDRPPLFPSAFRGKKVFGVLPTEQYAEMVAYLLSEGHPINEAGKEKVPAVEVLSELTGRSAKALQKDYYKHKALIEQNPGSIELGKARYEFKKRLRRIKNGAS